ncbi:transposase [Gluconobacter cerevisiae]|uniref:Transposase n=1 Tax=Gluconobacter cerevisiae TaxID=1379734 RepID=A0ABR9YFJ0_9PROT|nr:transposase [Gluconobacter cerevisiae]
MIVKLLVARRIVMRSVLCDRGYALNQFRETVWDRDSRPGIPPQRNQPQMSYPKYTYQYWRSVETLWSSFRKWRAVATRYEKTVTSFMTTICIAADWIKT